MRQPKVEFYSKLLQKRVTKKFNTTVDAIAFASKVKGIIIA